MKKTFFILILLFIGIAAVAQKNEHLSVKTDSIIHPGLDVVYRYRIVNDAGSVVYTYSSTTTDLTKTFEYKSLKEKLNYTCFTIYDYPTGRAAVILVNHRNGHLYKSGWFDDNATGDTLIKDKVDFEGGEIVIKETHKSEYYKARLSMPNMVDGTVKHVIPDTSINNKLFINNPASVFTSFGNIDSLLKEGEGLPEMYVKNRSGTQYLKMTKHFGSFRNSISEFEFGYTSDLADSIPAVFSNMVTFTTGSGIRLGIPLVEVIRIKGESYSSAFVRKKEVLITYIIDDFEGSQFLRRYNMPLYYAHYTCEDGKVKKVKFGFEYP